MPWNKKDGEINAGAGVGGGVGFFGWRELSRGWLVGCVFHMIGLEE